MKTVSIRWRLHGDESEPTARQRGINVINYLAKEGYNVGIWEGEEADIIVLQYDLRELDRALSTGATVVADINDFIFAPFHNKHKEIIENINKVHAVVAGSIRLFQHLRRLHPFVRMIEEAVDDRYFNVKREPHEGINIIWMGMHDNVVYFEEIDPVLERLSREFEFRVVFICPEKSTIHGSNEQYIKKKPYPTVYVKWTIEEVLKWMSIADIAVCPLFQNEWCRCKSANKAASFMAAGIPVVVSDVPSYRNIISHGRSGFLCLHPEDWEEALRQLLSDKNLRKEIGSIGKVAVRPYRIEKIGKEWLKFFEEIQPPS